MFYKKTIKKTSKQSYWEGFFNAFSCYDYLHEPPQQKLITKKDILKMRKDAWDMVGNHLWNAVNNYKENEKR